MSEQNPRHDSHNWDTLTPREVLATLVYELYTPVSALGSHLNRLTGEDDPLSEEEYEAIFEQMQQSVRQLSKTVVHLRRYMQDQEASD
jgi:K+-sensing histidine kinase KdpD